MKTLLLITFIFCINISYAKEKGKTPPTGYISASLDKSSIENEIYSYFRHIHKLTGEKIYNKKTKDLSLLYTIKQQGVPTLDFYIDTTSGSISNNNVVSTIQIYAYFQLPATLKEKVNIDKLLEFNNDFNRKIWLPQTICIVNNTDLLIKSKIIIPSNKLYIHSETIYSLLMNSAYYWKQYYKQLTKHFDLKEIQEKSL